MHQVKTCGKAEIVFTGMPGPGKGTAGMARVSESKGGRREIIVYTYMRPMTMHDQEYDLASALTYLCLICFRVVYS